MFGTYRTALALMVVAGHLGGVAGIGGYAVFGFYCLSGYLMTLIMQTSYGYSNGGIRKYALNRFLRIYPIYWVSIVFSALLILYLGNDYTTRYHPSIYFPNDVASVAKNILLFFPHGESPRLTPPAWALTVEIFFYIVIGLGASKTKRLTWTWFAISAMYHVIAILFGLDTYASIWAASLPFSAGALVFHYKNEITTLSRQKLGRTHNLAPFLIFALILFNWAVAYALYQLDGVFFYSNFVLCSLMVAILLSRTRLPFISVKLDKWLGDFSYPVYLIHYQVGLVVIVFFAVFGIEMHRPELLLTLVSIPAIFLFSWVITATIERPIELVRTKIKRQRRCEQFLITPARAPSE